MLWKAVMLTTIPPTPYVINALKQVRDITKSGQLQYITESWENTYSITHKSIPSFVLPKPFLYTSLIHACLLVASVPNLVSCLKLSHPPFLHTNSKVIFYTSITWFCHLHAENLSKAAQIFQAEVSFLNLAHKALHILTNVCFCGLVPYHTPHASSPLIILYIGSRKHFECLITSCCCICSFYCLWCPSSIHYM